MSQKSEFHNLDKPDDGLFRELAAGVTTRIFAGEQAMLLGHTAHYGANFAMRADGADDRLTRAVLHLSLSASAPWQRPVRHIWGCHWRAWRAW